MMNWNVLKQESTKNKGDGKMSKKFSSTSEEVRYYIKQLLADKEIHDTEEIRIYVKDAIKDKEITPGIFSGSLRDLLAKEPQYTNPKRGYYQLNDSDSVLLVAIEKIIKNAQEDINKEMGKMNIANMTREEFVEVEKTQEVLRKLNEILDQVSEQLD